MDIYLSQKQLNALKRNKGVQLSHRQLLSPTPMEKFGVGLHDGVIKKVLDSVHKKKGLRLKREHLLKEGGDLFKDIKKGVEKVAKKASKTISNVADDVVNEVVDVADDVNSKSVSNVASSAVKNISNAYKSVNKMALKNDWGSIVEQSKPILLPIMKQAIVTSLISQGVDPAVANTIASSMTGAAGAVDFSQSLKGQGDEAVKGALKEGVKSGVSQYTKQNKAPKTAPISSGKGLKGSQEMKDKMARLRAMRKGGSFRGSAVPISTASFRGSGLIKPSSFLGGSFRDY